jgi:hypothetical protein
MKTILQLLLTFASAYVEYATDAARVNQENDIREAVFRHQFDHNASGQRTDAAVYCLSVGSKETDPSDEFMKRFADHKPPVRKLSECNVDPVNGVVDKSTGKSGLIFRVTSITWVSDMEVGVAGGYYEAGLSSSGNTYTVRKEQGKWKVTADKMNWISQGETLSLIYC